MSGTAERVENAINEVISDDNSIMNISENRNNFRVQLTQSVDYDDIKESLEDEFTDSRLFGLSIEKEDNEASNDIVTVVSFNIR